MPTDSSTLLFIAMEISASPLETSAVSRLLLTFAPILILRPPIVPTPSSPPTILSIFTVPPAEIPEALIVLSDMEVEPLARSPLSFGLSWATVASNMLLLLLAKIAPDHSPIPPVIPSVVSIPAARNELPVTEVLANPAIWVLVTALTCAVKPLPITSCLAFSALLLPDSFTLVFLASYLSLFFWKSPNSLLSLTALMVPNTSPTTVMVPAASNAETLTLSVMGGLVSQ